MVVDEDMDRLFGECKTKNARGRLPLFASMTKRGRTLLKVLYYYAQDSLSAQNCTKLWILKFSVHTVDHSDWACESVPTLGARKRDPYDQYCTAPVLSYIKEALEASLKVKSSATSSALQALIALSIGPYTWNPGYQVFKSRNRKQAREEAVDLSSASRNRSTQPCWGEKSGGHSSLYS